MAKHHDGDQEKQTDASAATVKAKQPEHSQEEEEEEEEEEMPMPMPMPAASSGSNKKKRHNKHKQALDQVFAQNLPHADMYETSYMHRDMVSHVVVAQETQFIITASRDGHVKFWKKMARGIEFVKHYKAHLQEITSLAVSCDGMRLCSTSSDQSAKFYDVIGFDMVNMLQIGFVPSDSCWISPKGDTLQAKIAICEKNSHVIRIFQAEQVDAQPLHVLDKLHTAPVCALGFNAVQNCVVSCDLRGHLEYWESADELNEFKLPSREKIKFKFKGDTDLYELAKQKTFATSLSFDHQGTNFVVTAKDCQIRVFRFATGKLRRKYDESLVVFEDAQADGTLHLEPLDFGRRVAVEKELVSTSQAALNKTFCHQVASNCIFDETGHFLIYSTLLGVKIVNWETNQLIKVLGKVENSDRFLQVALFQGKPKVNSQFEKKRKLNENGAAVATKQSQDVMQDESAKASQSLLDPTLFCTSFKKNRFYLFSQREPLEASDGVDDEANGGSGSGGRDVFNEKPTLEESQVATETSALQKLGELAIVHTTMGDIQIKLFGKECPKTVENFCTHARNGYYDNVIFHRVIKNFMVQTGDPLGDGTGGESIWGGEFEDEFHRSLRHDRPFTVSMANAGPGTNGSQFFITTVPTPWLDNKHTVFGRVEHGKDTVAAIEQTRTDRFDKPVEEIKIINIDIS